MRRLPRDSLHPPLNPEELHGQPAPRGDAPHLPARPRTLQPCLTLLGVDAPTPVKATALPTDLTETSPAERRVDTLLRLEKSTEQSAFLLAIEAQGKKDPDKSASSAYYTAYLWTKYRLPTALLVVCQDHATAKWPQQPVSSGPPSCPPWNGLAPGHPPKVPEAACGSDHSLNRTPRHVHPALRTASCRGVFSSAESKRNSSVIWSLPSAPRSTVQRRETVLTCPRDCSADHANLGVPPIQVTSHSRSRARTSWFSGTRRIRI